MNNDLLMEEFFKRFSTYSSPTDHQKRFLKLYKNKSNLLPGEVELLNATFKTLKNIDKLAKEKIKLNELDKLAKKEKRKNDTHIKILIGSALLAGTKCESVEKYGYRNSLNNLLHNGFFKESDEQKIKDYLAEIGY